MIRLGISIAASATLLAGCTSIRATPATFEGTSWHVTTINDQATPESAQFQIRFGARSLSAVMGCNSASGDYRIDGDTLVPGPIAATKMACQAVGLTPLPLMEYEAQGFAVLSRPMRMEWHSAQRLTLRNAAGSIALEGLP